ncbi:anhydro-N-acetylmuramic acid kinase [Halopseudomonas xinjiangensis]|uniref:Anhydro-N-acetylmuramic acid kinase n=1 Tax=Halopseudomonas xinjiangensis TaxID=487184 RepID=A0A1H1WHK7_9GAMM|nr:anhydro-N-acetylmuramic acid kinase [Halopseudomonas xinjiangensis]SDS96574.1 anhydro-N-acetylmuramic acid kinase [Halopseudomonas xinjiangensis]
MPSLHVGIMSGTSLDGIDIAVASLDSDHRSAELLGAICLPLPPELKTQLLDLCQPGTDEVRRAAAAGQAWARLAAEGVATLLMRCNLQAADILTIGSHGQTIRHHPELGFSLQIGAPALLAELTGITVITDFRSRDVAAGGQGAPLVPAFHDWLLSDPNATRVLVNIGGFANLTILQPGLSVTGFDSGPGNVLMDAWCALHTGRAFDAGGAWASRGRPIPPLLASMLADPYFSKTGPKSTGREYFNQAWLKARLQGFPFQPEAVDVQATLLELTAQTIAAAANEHNVAGGDLFICGGGARNDYLMLRLQQLLSDASVRSTEALGVDPDWMEAMAFAWLASRCISGRPGNLPAVTGARGPRVLGAIYQA